MSASPGTGGVPDLAIVLAAGLGKRMRPLTDTRPKPLVEVGGRTLLDRGLDVLAHAGVARAIVNVHYLPDQIVAHVTTRERPGVAISDERERLLDSGGGVRKALPEGRADPVLLLNADTFWLDAPDRNAIETLGKAWDPARMDMLLLLAASEDAVGHTGTGDFAREPDGRIRRDRAGHVYAGAAILKPSIFRGDEPEIHSLNLHFDRLVASGRLHGAVMEGLWLTVGTPGAIEEAERAMALFGARGAASRDTAA